MRGSPITRTTSRDGRWAYTLYDGAGGTPFVHALDTSRRQARCIDLPMLVGATNLWQLRIGRSADGTALRVGAGGSTLAVIATDGFRVSLPPPAATRTSPDRSWPVAGATALGALLLAAAFTVGIRRLRARPIAA
jgi:hypothetical protein